MFLFRKQSRDSPTASLQDNCRHNNDQHDNHRGSLSRRSSDKLFALSRSSDVRCGLCEMENLEKIVLQCPLSRSRLQDLCEHLVHSNCCSIDTAGRNGMTALHFAVLKGDERTTRAFLAFGADVNVTNEFNQTPLDIATQNQINSLVPLLVSCGCETGETISRIRSSLSSYLPPLSSPPPSIEYSSAQATPHKLSPIPSHSVSTYPRLVVQSPPSIPPTPVPSPKTKNQLLVLEMTQAMERRFELSASLQPDEALAIAKQQQEILRLRGKSSDAAEQAALPWAVSLPEVVGVAGGCRILCLDGGGIRGLVQIEALSEIERRTGRRIVELFDWIIGTSTGGIIALVMVYCKHRPISYLRGLYFRMKDQLFAKGRMGCAYSTLAMESILKEEFGTDMKMMDVRHPKVLVSAVNKSTVQPKLHWFNNCFYDNFSTQPVWKVARYTSAAPLHFTECDNYVDGGMLANNPSDTGLTRIQQHYHERRERLSISCVVSLGSGLAPSEELGCVGPDFNLRSVLNLGDTWRRTSNLLKLLSHALGESEEVAKKCRCSCEGQGIPFFRLSPQLDEKIDSGETDTAKLLDMLINTKIYTCSDPQTPKLVALLLQLLPHDSVDDMSCSL